MKVYLSKLVMLVVLVLTTSATFLVTTASLRLVWEAIKYGWFWGYLL